MLTSVIDWLKGNSDLVAVVDWLKANRELVVNGGDLLAFFLVTPEVLQKIKPAMVASVYWVMFVYVLIVVFTLMLSPFILFIGPLIAILILVFPGLISVGAIYRAAHAKLHKLSVAIVSHAFWVGVSVFLVSRTIAIAIPR